LTSLLNSTMRFSPDARISFISNSLISIRNSYSKINNN
jgi:hypothetical protein